MLTLTGPDEAVRAYGKAAFKRTLAEAEDWVTVRVNQLTPSPSVLLVCLFYVTCFSSYNKQDPDETVRAYGRIAFERTLYIYIYIICVSVLTLTGPKRGGACIRKSSIRTHAGYIFI